jgi:MFS family permease
VMRNDSLIIRRGSHAAHRRPGSQPPYRGHVCVLAGHGMAHRSLRPTSGDVIGIAFLLAACALAGTAGHDSVRLSIGLMALGIGWSSTIVAGSTLLTESVSAELRTSAQGLSDLTMGLADASAGALSGVIVQAWGFPMLALVAAVATTPLIVLATQRARS